MQKKEAMSNPIQIIADNAENFEKSELKYGLYYLIGVDKDDDHVCELDGHLSCCIDCTDKAVDDYTKKLKDNPEEIDYGCSDKDFQQVVRVVATEQGCPESDDFVYCGYCGSLIHTGVLNTFSQEIDHWLDENTSINIENITAQDCYIINHLIQYAESDYPRLISPLKIKIKEQNQ